MAILLPIHVLNATRPGAISWGAARWSAPPASRTYVRCAGRAASSGAGRRRTRTSIPAARASRASTKDLFLGKTSSATTSCGNGENAGTTLRRRIWNQKSRRGCRPIFRIPSRAPTRGPFDSRARCTGHGRVPLSPPKLGQVLRCSCCCAARAWALGAPTHLPSGMRVRQMCSSRGFWSRMRRACS